MKEAALPLAYSLNGGNLQDTGHSTDPTPTSAMAEEHSFADPDWAGSGSPLCGCLHKDEEPTDEDQSAREPVKLKDWSAKLGIFPDKCFPALTDIMTSVSS